MVTLLQIASYDSAIVIQRAMGEAYPAAWLFFAAFMVIVSIGVMELMNGIFIEALLEEKRKLDNDRKLLDRVHQDEVSQLMVNLFNTYDVDKNGALDGHELECCLSIFDDAANHKLMQEVGIDAVKMMQALHVADIDCSGTITEQEFRMAVNSLHEPPMRLHLGVVQRKNVEVQSRLLEEMRRKDQKMSQQHDEMAKLLQSMDARMASIEGALLRKTPGGSPSRGVPPTLPPL